MSQLYDLDNFGIAINIRSCYFICEKKYGCVFFIRLMYDVISVIMWLIGVTWLPKITVFKMDAFIFVAKVFQ